MTTRNKPTLKELQTEPNYAVVSFGYQKIVLPHKAALQLMDALGQAERYSLEDYSNPCIEPVQQDQIELTLLSRKKYVQLKTAHLLGIPSSELEEKPGEEAA